MILFISLNYLTAFNSQRLQVFQTFFKPVYKSYDNMCLHQVTITLKSVNRCAKTNEEWPHFENSP